MYMFNHIELYQAVVIVFAIIGVTVMFITTRVNASKDYQRKLNHQEFEARLNLEHEETMAKVLSNRDIEIAKATHKEPSTTLDGNAKRLE